jgi:hypothetical protein
MTPPEKKKTVVLIDGNINMTPALSIMAGLWESG